MAEDLKALGTASGDLQALKNDVKTKTDMAEAQELARLEQAQRCMSRVEEIQVEVDESNLVRENNKDLERLSFGGCSSSNGKSSYNFGKEVVDDILEAITDLKRHRTFSEVVGVFVAPVDRRQTEPTPAMQAMMDQVWRQLEEPKVGIVGLYGMERVGKTTLLEQIHKRYFDNPNDFDFIIWVVISRNFVLEKVQNEIGIQIGCFDSSWKIKNHHQRASDILRLLRRKKFVLLLDDVWPCIDLKDVGVPVPDETNHSKLVFTTRDEVVCWKMRAHKKFLVK